MSRDRCSNDVDDTTGQRALVAKARLGDAGAWESLYRRLYPQLAAYAGRRLDREAARDAVSEAMARAVARIGRFTWEGGGFDAWVFGILRHVVVDAQRARAASFSGTEPDEAPSSEPGPLDHVLGAERGSALRAAFGRLSLADQEVLELRVVAGLSSDEVAAVVGKRPGAVRMAQARALERLRELLEEQEA
jgi:RNA polymerase sigma-70 factor (ECF subfamily)